jgi:signal peptide peptidase SppA
MKRTPLIDAFVSTPWALEPAHLSRLALMASSGNVLEYSRMRAEIVAARQAASQAKSGGGVAVIPVYGVIGQRDSWSTDTSTDFLSDMLDMAATDPMVGAILMDIDSPGGSVYGIQELAARINSVKAEKPVGAIANSLAASAAYWIGSAASEFNVTPGGDVGSIGVWMAHMDFSKMLDEAGIKTTLISAGKYKVEGNPYQPLDDEGRDFLQSRVDDYYGSFTQAVAKGRAVPIAQVRDGMGQGRVLGADAALGQRMVDGIMPMDDMLKKMQRAARASAKTGASRLAAAQRELSILS